jgi:hypothetical protein
MPGKRRPYMATAPQKPVDEPAQSAKAVKIGRPTTFTPEIAIAICERIVKPEGLTSICEDDNMPAKSTVYSWMKKDPRFNAMVEEAQKIQAAAYVDEIVTIADDSKGDYILKPDGTPVPVWESTQRSKLRVDARRMVAAVLDPERFGTNKIEQKIVGDPARPVYVDRPMTAVEVQAEMERLIAEAEEETGITTIEGLSHKERIRNLIVSEQPLPPTIYQIAYNRGETVN